jgi:hypothetical protein
MTQSLSLLPSSEKPHNYVRAAFIWVIIQIIKVIHHHGWALLIIPHKCMVEVGRRHLKLSIYQDDFMRHMCFLLRDNLHRAFIIDLFRCGSRGVGIGGAAASPPSSASSSSFILGILSHAVKSSLPGDLH